MDDLIKRADAIQALAEYLMEDAQFEWGGMASEDIEDWKDLAEQILRDIPSAEPKRGRWEWNQYDGNPAIGNYHCSICRWLVPHDKYAFCPNCGARMK